MSRYISSEDPRQTSPEQNRASRMRLSQGRGEAGPDDTKERRRSGSKSAGSARPGSSGELTELTTLIDAATSGNPTMGQFIERLEQSGVEVLPSIQSSGRLNGFAFRFGGQTMPASKLGRAYTPRGLQRRRGVSYDAGRDAEVLRRVAEHAGLPHPPPREIERDRPSEGGRDRSGRRRERGGELSLDQKATLAEIGKFRTVNIEDLVRHRYEGSAGEFNQDLRVLRERGLVDERTVAQGRSQGSSRVVVLTRNGRNLLRHDIAGAGPQRYYAGFVKPAEVRHDAAIYRMYQVEAARIESDGGKIRRIVLDYELKRNVYSKLNKNGADQASDHRKRKHEIASANDLAVVNGRVVFPDLRIEYETRDHDMAKVDLELATDQYKDAEVQQKRAAGLRIYGPDSAPRSPALEDPALVAGLISF
jgi:hypothetical protein